MYTFLRITSPYIKSPSCMWELMGYVTDLLLTYKGQLVLPAVNCIGAVLESMSREKFYYIVQMGNDCCQFCGSLAWNGCLINVAVHSRWQPRHFVHGTCILFVLDYSLVSIWYLHSYLLKVNDNVLKQLLKLVHGWEIALHCFTWIYLLINALIPMLL